MTALTYDEEIVDLSAHELEDEDDADERWHVQLAPGDVRVLSLDQLDDMYRLDLINDDTLVWQDGMDGWLPLSVVLSESDDEPADPFGSTSFAPAPLAPLPSFAPAPLAPVSMPPAPLAPVASFAPAPLAPVSMPPAPLAPVASFAPAPLAPISRPPAPLAPVASFAPAPFVPTTPPVAFSVPALPPRAGAGERWLIGLAVAAGLLATLQRNDVLSQVAHSANQQAAFTQAEQRLLGGPSFGTMRSVEQLLEQHQLRVPPVRLPLAVEAAAAAKPPATEPAKASTEPAAPTPKPAEPARAAQKPAETKSAAVAGALAGKRSQPRQTAPARATRSVPSRSKSKGDSVIPGSRPTRGRSAEYDPLNGNL